MDYLFIILHPCGGAPIGEEEPTKEEVTVHPPVYSSTRNVSGLNHFGGAALNK